MGMRIDAEELPVSNAPKLASGVSTTDQIVAPNVGLKYRDVDALPSLARSSCRREQLFITARDDCLKATIDFVQHSDDSKTARVRRNAYSDRCASEHRQVRSKINYYASVRTQHLSEIDRWLTSHPQ